MKQIFLKRIENEVITSSLDIFVSDIKRINNISVFAKNTGMIILGGGLIKHHICNANLMVSNVNVVLVYTCSVLVAVERLLNIIIPDTYFRAEEG